MGIDSFVSYLSGLSPNTSYFVRAYATNSVGTIYGSDVFFQTNANAPSLNPTFSAFNISEIGSHTVSFSALLSSEINHISSRGFCWSFVQNPTILNSHVEVGKGVGSYAIKEAGFIGGGTRYYARPFAVNSYGVFYGEEKIFLHNLTYQPYNYYPLKILDFLLLLMQISQTPEVNQLPKEALFIV